MSTAFREILQKFHPESVALLGVKLNANDVVSHDGRSEQVSILRLTEYIGVVMTLDIVRMDEVETMVVYDPVP